MPQNATASAVNMPVRSIILRAVANVLFCVDDVLL